MVYTSPRREYNSLKISSKFCVCSDVHFDFSSQANKTKASLDRGEIGCLPLPIPLS